MNQYEAEMLALYKKSLGEKQEYHGIVCPSTWKKPCRLCELCKEILFDKKIPKEAPLRKKASSLNSKQHYFSNVLFLTDPSEIAIFEYGDKIFKQLLAFQMNPVKGAVDFWHPITGRWLVIERIQGATKDQVDYYVTTKDVTKLGTMDVLGKLSDQKYNLTNIVDSIKAGIVKPIYQSKLDKLVSVRILPSWLGPDFAMKFFMKVEYHFNISEEDFASCMAGEINPVKILGDEARKEVRPDTEVDKYTPQSGWGVAVPGQAQISVMQKPEPLKAVNPYEKMWSEPPKAAIEQKVEEQASIDDNDELPACYGDYDSTEPDCNNCADWKVGCDAYRKEKMERRKAAKRLSR